MRESIKVKVQSMIDIITNSSTEVFVTATSKTVEAMKELCEMYLKAEGCTEPIDDVLEFKIEENECWSDYYTESGVLITSKKEEYNKFVHLLEGLINTYSFDGCYNG